MACHVSRSSLRLAAIVTSLCTCLTAAALTTSSASAAQEHNASTSLVSELADCKAPKTGKPTVVLIHGAWADTSSWSGEVRLLREAGYPVRAIGNPLRDLTSDSRTVAEFLRTIKGPVVLAGHSYGGSVITNAAAQTDNVKALVYVDAAAPAIGETTGELSGETSALNTSPPEELYDKVPYPGAPSGAADLYLKKDVFLKNFAGDLPAGQAADLWATQRAASSAAFSTPSKYEAWRKIPSWYFISTGDQIITPESEEMMARRAHSKVTKFQGGSHLTLISHPDAVSSVIGSAICSVRGSR
ncbi:alpha/beta hydrolase [Streptomyces sp. NPDC006923]|uniref:alpha/beta hydrolase n=1 Tax=Streptomyces sp. NPDC006923 TaxID=3155355 RepID=UPI0033DFB0C1